MLSGTQSRLLTRAEDASFTRGRSPGSIPGAPTGRAPLRRGFFSGRFCTSCSVLGWGPFLEQSDWAGTMGAMPGHPETLVARHAGNVNAVRHGVHSRTGHVLAPRAAELADELMQRPHVQPLDRVAAEEIRTIVVRLELRAASTLAATTTSRRQVRRRSDSTRTTTT